LILVATQGMAMTCTIDGLREAFFCSSASMSSRKGLV
jgi:hypothetical protein